MANGLEVDTAGLRSGAHGSDAIAAALATGSVGGPSSDGPSSSGVAAVDAAISSVRMRQAGRVSGLARDLSAGSDRYDHTDEDRAADVTVPM